MNFINKNLRVLMVFIIFIISLSALIFKNNLDSNLFQTLGYIVTGCLGFILRGKT